MILDLVASNSVISLGLMVVAGLLCPPLFTTWQGRRIALALLLSFFAGLVLHPR